MEAMQLSNWLCPACNSNTNSQGVVFSSSRAIALHIAGKIRAGDKLHLQWAKNNISDGLSKPDIFKSINTLADVIKPQVLVINRARMKNEEERIHRIIEERDTNAEPRVLAYKHIQDIETQMHLCVCQTLKDSYGPLEDEWWVKGIPTHIRIDCSKRREEDSAREELFSYTNLIHLKPIIENNRSLFESRLFSVDKQPQKQKEFLDEIVKCNDLRNKVMHPIRSLITNEDLSFLKQFKSKVIVFVK